jgi:lipopolysaccharide/colanic/teichoic acid biosynthesis glycosyltransferase
VATVTPLRRSEQPSVPRRDQPSRTGPNLISEALFRGVLARERKRADRSNRPLFLVLLALKGASQTESAPIWRSVVDALAATRRETDVIGWFEHGAAVGLILSEVSESDDFPRDVNERVSRELSWRLDAQTAGRVSIWLHVHPVPKGAEEKGVRPVDPIVSQGRPGRDRQRYCDDALKRAFDVAVSLTLLAILSPLFLVIAALVKVKSPGAVFFRQERVGQMMKPFMMLKFRTMSVNADPAIHHQFVSSFIKSGGQAQASGKTGLYKITDDPRVTAIGRFLRRTSLDELPQLWNVLRGDMSLVGPRPPLQYEVEQYQSWHKRRVLEAKPGLTGLWQVSGRSCTTFDEMVRLDLRYARSYSVWTDIKIILATPRAVISGKGAC